MEQDAYIDREGHEFTYVPGARIPTDEGKMVFGHVLVEGDVFGSVKIPHVGYPGTAAEAPPDFSNPAVRDVLLDRAIHRQPAADPAMHYEVVVKGDKALIELLLKALDPLEFHGPPYNEGNCVTCKMQRQLEVTLGIDRRHA